MKAKSNHFLTRLVAAISLLAFAVTGTSCMTTYDAYGRPMQTVDPGVAVAGAAAAGVLGYAIANDNRRHHHHHYHRAPRHYPRYYR
ncbi:MAG: hypothetical protein QM627_10520 [Luteolibacter sp.]